MTRLQTLLVTTALAATIPLAPALAQNGPSNCGPETWSTEKMAYVRTPCNAGDAAQVGTSGPTAYGSGSSTTMTKAEMKQMPPYGYAQPGYAPMQSQAVVGGPSYAMGDNSCGPSNAVAIKDEYGHKYNCRGDRIR